MSDEKHPYTVVNEAPIPTYEEATSSRPTSHLGPREISDDAERQGLLHPDTHDSFAVGSSSRRRNGYYQPPSVQSVRSSEDSDLDLQEINSDNGSEGPGEEAELRREIQEMEIDDVESAESSRRRRRRGAFTKRITSLTASLSNLHLPRIRFPKFSFIFDRIRFPTVSDHVNISWPIVARLMGLFVVVSLVYALFMSEMFNGMPGGGGLAQAFNPEYVRSFAQKSINVMRIKDNLRYLTSYDHVAGTKGSYAMGQWIEERFRENHLEGITVEEYEVYLNYPTESGRKVSIVEPADMAWTASLEEGNAYDHSNSEQSTQQTLAFHGLSKSGKAKGPLIYANYGSKEDIKRLADSHINCVGAILLVRAGGSPADPASKVKAAQDIGAVGILIYNDPADDGISKGPEYPQDRWRPANSVLRDSVALTSYIMGDVLTPGDPSRPTVNRISKDNNPGLVNIVSLPLSWKDASRLLKALKGHGNQLPEEWIGGVPEIDEWWSGSEESPIVEIQNEQSENEKQPIYNIIGTFHGYETPRERIIVGNHRDAWCFGAVDPGSGTAVMLEVIRILGELRAQGWRPLRSIVFASWDAKEYNLMGSTEFVEDHIDDLRSSGVAYLDVSAGVYGDKLHFGGSPLLERAFTRILGRVPDRLQNATMSEILEQNPMKMDGLGAGGDYAPFQSIAGISSVNFGFKGESFPSHSCYETYEWMEKFGDPNFNYHQTLTEIWVLLILELSQEPIIPFNLKDYTDSVFEYINDLNEYAKAHDAPWDDAGDEKDGKTFNTEPLQTAAAQLAKDAAQFQTWEDRWWAQVAGSGGLESHATAVHRVGHNERLIGFEKALLDLPMKGAEEDGRVYGTPGRTQYKHAIFGPDTNDAYAPAYFPGVRDAIDKRDWDAAKMQIEKAAELIRRASQSLLH